MVIFKVNEGVNAQKSLSLRDSKGLESLELLENLEILDCLENLESPAKKR